MVEVIGVVATVILGLVAWWYAHKQHRQSKVVAKAVPAFQMRIIKDPTIGNGFTHRMILENKGAVARDVEYKVVLPASVHVKDVVVEFIGADAKHKIIDGVACLVRDRQVPKTMDALNDVYVAKIKMRDGGNVANVNFQWRVNFSGGEFPEKGTSTLRLADFFERRS